MENYTEETKKFKTDKSEQDIKDAVNMYVGGLSVFVGGLLLMIYSVLTYYNDLKSSEYTYTDNFMLHEYIVVIMIVVAAIAIFSGLVLVWSNKKTACSRLKYGNELFVISHVAFIALLIFIVSLIFKCDLCGDLSFGYAETDLMGERELCNWCAREYWSI